nr:MULTISPECIES: hypothetical protein [unclassified Pseudomonas]
MSASELAERDALQQAYVTRDGYLDKDIMKPIAWLKPHYAKPLKIANLAE